MAVKQQIYESVVRNGYSVTVRILLQMRMLANLVWHQEDGLEENSNTWKHQVQAPWSIAIYISGTYSLVLIIDWIQLKCNESVVGW